MPLFVDEDGKSVPAPIGIDPIDPEQGFARLQAIVMADLRLVGMSLRKVAALFGIPKSNVDRIVKCVPADLAERCRDARYLRRLKEVVDADPSDFHELMGLMLDKNGVGFDDVARIMAGLGNRRRSVETAVGLRQRRRKPKHVDAVD